MTRRVCVKCGKNRDVKFYSGPRGRVCSSCRRRRTQVASRAVRLAETYDITTEEYQALLEAQGGRCAICGGSRSYNLDVDHDHALAAAGVPIRDTVRGLLCKQCNRRVLRSARDSIEVLEAAVAYLKDPPAQAILSTTSVE